MRCHFCFQAIPDRTERCPFCGSRQPVDESRPAGEQRKEKSRAPMTGRQVFTSIVILVVIFGCAATALAVMIRPGILPSQVIAALNLGTPLPTSPPQVTRASIATPTPLVWEDHVNEQAGFQMQFPGNWLVVNRSPARWRIDARRLAKEYPWALELFEVLSPLEWKQSRATDPTAVDEKTGQIVLFDIGPATGFEDELSFDAIQELARETPEALVELIGPFVSDDISAERTEQIEVNGRDALLVEFSAQTKPWGDVESAGPIRIRQYYVQGPGGLYLVSYLVSEDIGGQNQALYDQIVQSFEIIE